jgi:hypothetical protein
MTMATLAEEAYTRGFVDGWMGSLIEFGMRPEMTGNRDPDSHDRVITAFVLACCSGLAALVVAVSWAPFVLLWLSYGGAWL